MCFAMKRTERHYSFTAPTYFYQCNSKQMDTYSLAIICLCMSKHARLLLTTGKDLLLITFSLLFLSFIFKWDCGHLEALEVFFSEYSVFFLDQN